MNQPNQDREIIAFCIGDQEFGVDVVSVREIRGWTKATSLPNTPDFVCGIINLRGTVLPVIDMSARLGLGASDPTARHVVIVVEEADQLVGLLVNGVSEILTAAQSDVQPTPNLGRDGVGGFIEGILVQDGRLVSLLSLGAAIPRPTREAA